MFSGPLDRIRKTISFRLTVWYWLIFILSSVAVFGLAYVLLSSSLQQKDREIVRSKLKEYVAQYRSGGMHTLIREIGIEQHTGRQNSLFVRVADLHNNTLFLHLPEQWEGFDLKQLETRDIPGREWIDLLAKDDETMLEIASSRLPDGSLLQVGKSTEDREELLERFRDIFAVIMILVLLIGFTGGIFLALHTLRPLRGLIEVLRAIVKTGKMNARVPIRQTGDELDELGGLFNELLERIEALIKGLRASLDNVAHDLRTPMTRLRGTAELALQSNQTTEVCQEALADCLEESERVLTMLDTLMDISEAETGVMTLNLERVSLPALIQEVVELYHDVAEQRGISIHTRAPELCHLMADGNRLRQVLANLLDNAIKYTPSGGRVDIEAQPAERRVRVTVEDTGIGISAEELPKIWDRLYRGDQSRSQRGLGLGLSLVKAIVRAHRGTIEVSSQPGRGSRFTLSLPVNLAQSR